MQRFLIMTALIATSSPAFGESASIQIPSVDRMREICREVRPAEGLRFDGNAFERGQKRAAHRRQRDDALGRLFTIDIPAQDYDFLEYDPDSQEMEVDLSEGLRPQDGRIILGPQPHDRLDVVVTPELARDLASRHGERHLDLRIGFYLDPQDPVASPCTPSRSNDTPLRVEVEIAFFELRGDGGEVLARAGAVEATPPVRSTTPEAALRGANPSVTFGQTSVIADGSLDELLEGPGGEPLRQRFTDCYRQRLADRPGIEGTVVVQMIVSGGHLRSAHLEIDSLGDPGVGACILRHTRNFEYPRTVSGAVSLPVRFQP
jgi:hypothetical protein